MPSSAYTPWKGALMPILIRPDPVEAATHAPRVPSPPPEQTKPLPHSLSDAQAQLVPSSSGETQPTLPPTKAAPAPATRTKARARERMVLEPPVQREQAAAGAGRDANEGVALARLRAFEHEQDS